MAQPAPGGEQALDQAVGHGDEVVVAGTAVVAGDDGGVLGPTDEADLLPACWRCRSCGRAQMPRRPSRCFRNRSRCRYTRSNLCVRASAPSSPRALVARSRCRWHSVSPEDR